MGIPAFYSWLSQKYSRINRKYKPATVDNLYLDVNGLIHSACQSGGGGYLHEEGEMVERVVDYIEQLIEMMAPTKLVYVAIDGVAPRAKLNQQRCRRFQSARDRCLADAAELDMPGLFDDDDNNEIEAKKTRDELNEIKDGLNLGIFAGDVTTEQLLSDPEESDGGLAGFFGDEPLDQEKEEESQHPPSWDSNAITPGTEFMQKVATALHKWAADRRGPLVVVVSDSNQPGEGEHKFIDFLRLEKAGCPRRRTSPRNNPWFDPNDSHAIVSLDADIILLSLSLHLPNIYIVREDRRHPPMERFEYCFVNNLREQLAEELTGKIAKYHSVYRRGTAPPSDPPDFERLLVDFVFMMTFAGNDFLPHLPAAYIGQLTGDLLMDLYERRMARDWTRRTGYPYLVSSSGTINYRNFCALLEMYAWAEDSLFRQEAVFDKTLTEEEADGAGGFRSTTDRKWKEVYYDSIAEVTKNPGPTPAEMSRAWLEGLAWVNYYYNNPGTISWAWFYPHYHAPLASDMLDYLEEEGTDQFFEDVIRKLEESSGAPLQPKQQLLAVLPPGSFHLLPEGYGETFRQEQAKSYPSSWAFDLTGCRAEYHGVAVLPFLEAQHLLDATNHETRPENTAWGAKVYDDGSKTFYAHERLANGGLTRKKGIKGTSEWHPLSKHPPVGSVEVPLYIPWREGAARRRTRVEKLLFAVGVVLFVFVFRKRRSVLLLTLGVAATAAYVHFSPPPPQTSIAVQTGRKCKVAKVTTAFEFLKPKRCRVDWVCLNCLAKNWERQTECFRCKIPKKDSDILVYLPKNNRWSTSCYTSDHRAHCTEI